MCAKFRFSISSRCDDIFAGVKGGGQLYAPPAAGGWRGGPAAAGVNHRYKNDEIVRLNNKVALITNFVILANDMIIFVFMV